MVVKLTPTLPRWRLGQVLPLDRRGIFVASFEAVGEDDGAVVELVTAAAAGEREELVLELPGTLKEELTEELAEELAEELRWALLVRIAGGSIVTVAKSKASEVVPMTAIGLATGNLKRFLEFVQHWYKPPSGSQQ
ncbi:MAG: hypothetical protein M4579_002130 [Chaenotheca gracillima]|nr:MAG: hypothetical protein M4579_002130 [Chaenotheca gracillima]